MARTKTTRLTRRAINATKVLRAVAEPEAGAVALFLGTVRNRSEAGKVERIRYEAYEPMAEKVLLETERELSKRWPEVTKVKILHRIGNLSIGDISVAIAVSSPHREEAFEACRYAIEKIKHEAPIWKKEKLADGSDAWVKGTPLAGARGEPLSQELAPPR